MQIGDPKKTAVLGVVAVGALGFCFMQLFGGGSAPKVLRQANAATQPGAGGTLIAMQMDDLRVDPFSHPKLARLAPGQSPNPGAPAEPGIKPAGLNPLPVPNKGTDPKTGAIGIGPDDSWKPPMSAGTENPPTKPTDVKVEKLTQVSLKAIVKVNQRLAYLAIDGQDARSFRPGDFIKNDIEVVSVNDDSVTVKSSKTTVTLKVGQQGDL